jgi:hypothetical protein
MQTIVRSREAHCHTTGERQIDSVLFHFTTLSAIIIVFMRFYTAKNVLISRFGRCSHLLQLALKGFGFDMIACQHHDTHVGMIAKLTGQARKGHARNAHV